MNYFEQAHKQFFFKILLGLYLVANFSVSIIEGVHFLMHMNDEMELHSFQAHSSTHSHKTLNLIDNLLIHNNPSEAPNTTDNKLKFKKIIQFLKSNSNTIPGLNTTIKSNFSFFIAFHKSPFLKASCPPPDVQYV